MRRARACWRTVHSGRRARRPRRSPPGRLRRSRSCRCADPAPGQRLSPVAAAAGPRERGLTFSSGGGSPQWRSTMPDRSARILLVDDEQSIQTLLSYPLRKEGYDVVQATDGNEALERFGDGSFDLVVLDLMLPGIDGLEVCRRLRSR